MRKLPEDRPCSKCGKSFPEVVFRIRSSGGRESWCRCCEANADRNRYHSDPGKYKGIKQISRDKNRESTNLSRTNWIRNNPIKNKASKTAWRLANPARSLAITHRYRTRRKNLEGTWTGEQWEQLKALFNYSCLRCGLHEPEIILTFDHIIPVSRGGLNTIENAQPLCRSCNSRKNDKIRDYRPHKREK